MNNIFVLHARALISSILRKLPIFLVAVLAYSQTSPVPVTNAPGRELNFDFPEMRIGVAEYDEGPTGTTVFYFPDGVKAAVDVRGGAPGTVNAAALMNAYDRKMMEAVVFSGGSWYGLSAATGVANAIKDQKLEEGDPDFIAGVVAAIIYDVGWRRMSRITPDDALGRAALNSARSGWFPLGAHGAGRSASQGSYFTRKLPFELRFARWPHSGQGGAFKQIGETKIAVFTVVNALGAITDRSGRLVRCGRNFPGENCPLVSDLITETAGAVTKKAEETGKTKNTTLTLFVTNQKMPFAELQRIAKQVHGSMARAIQPFSSREDGDVLYAVTTDQVENPGLDVTDLGVIGSELAWDAVLSSVPELPPLPKPLAAKPKPETLVKFVGDYEFNKFWLIGVFLENGELVAKIGGAGQIFFNKPSHRLIPAEGSQFIVDLPAKDVIRFDFEEGKVTGLTLNPGPWANKAKKTK